MLDNEKNTISAWGGTAYYTKQAFKALLSLWPSKNLCVDVAFERCMPNI